ncbi:hypothetical protein [Pseudomonas turukhanskensis]|uniref:Tetratricopeptide repeat protein n=1 Tax=Pseudomonas turukhanskensis TaxID=1806536 RepID=A0A9W6K776_9PSED|nr:hypothetical protein [Pseudomonas turukhanskensis]GLK90751.1 hypothetical protein GCM10017655_38150 [Pseudomonas turukhanskensis]
MSRLNLPRCLLAVAVAAVLTTPLASACGPDYPLRLLGDRARSLQELPEGNFNFEAGRLAVATPALKQAASYNGETRWYAEGQSGLEEAEPQGLTPEQAAKVKALRSLTDPAQAEQAGAQLPAELRLYTAGAVAFAQGDDVSAQAYFQKVLALPASERPLRSTWAAYSLGRSLARGADAARDGEPSDEQRAQARQADIKAAKQAFGLTRQLAVDGASDPLELGIASLGEEARLALDAGDWSTAIGLYASQLKLGSTTGYSSMKQLAVELTQMPADQLAPLLQQLPVQQLLTAYLISHAGWSYGEQPAGEKALVQQLQRGDIANLANADRLAALSYQFGDYDATATLLEHAPDNGLTWWLRAKMALRSGDKAAAQAAYAKAAHAFPEDESWGWRRDADWNGETVKPRCRVEGEGAILALERGDYLQAFEALYRSGYIYWADTAEVAERVLTTDELKTFVDANVPAPPSVAAPPDPYAYQPRPIEAELRQLLGRRLLREGRYDQAPAYFYEVSTQQAARDYGQARQAAESRWTDTGKAQALYQAGKLARRQGMELLGYEMSPDFAWFDGLYSLDRVQTQEPGGLLSRGEVDRQNANLAAPNNRYHYRWVAAELGSQAADLLPHTSQAYAATLCHATGWIQWSDQQLAQNLYRRYVANGPAVPWAANFGNQCPEPRFETVDRDLWQLRLDTLRRAARPYKGWLFGLALVAGVVAAGYWRKKRRITVPPAEL